MTNIISLKAHRTKTDVSANPVTNINITASGSINPSTVPTSKGKASSKPVKSRDLDTTTVDTAAGVSETSTVEDIVVSPYDAIVDEPSEDVVIVHTDEEHIKLVNEVKFLKIIISMLNNNPLIYSGCLLVDDEKLVELLLLLTQADEIQIDADDIMEGCLTGRTYRKVHAIYITKDGETKQLKYDYPELCQELNDLKIMWKYVW